MLKNFLDFERLIHSFKTAIACAIGFSLTKLITFPADQWVIITIIVVMCSQIYVGSVVQKAYLRFLGTLIGCITSALVLHYFGDNNLVILCTITISSLFFSYLATGQESFMSMGTLGAVTTAIIMLGMQPTVAFAMQRFLEISAGLLIAFLVSQFIFPIHARTHLRRAQACCLEKLRDYYELTMQETNNDTAIDFHDLDESIVKSLLKQRQLAKESSQEHFGSSFDRFHFTESLYYEREILRAITFMQNALTQLKKEDMKFIYSKPAQEFNTVVIESLDTLIKHINIETTPEMKVRIPSISNLHNELQSLLTNPTQTTLICSHAFLFSAGIVAGSLEKLAQLNGLVIESY